MRIAVDVAYFDLSSNLRVNITSVGTLQTVLHCSVFEKFFRNHKGFLSCFALYVGKMIQRD